MSAVLETRGLTKRFGDVTAVSELSFAIQEGTVTGFLGPNGAGKTTTLRMLLGLAEPTGGQALVFGRPYRDLEQPARRSATASSSTRRSTSFTRAGAIPAPAASTRRWSRPERPGCRSLASSTAPTRRAGCSRSR